MQERVTDNIVIMFTSRGSAKVAQTIRVGHMAFDGGCETHILESLREEPVLHLQIGHAAKFAWCLRTVDLRREENATSAVTIVPQHLGRPLSS